MTHRMLLDTSSLMYRAFFSVPLQIKDREGRSVNAARGYLDMTAFLLSTHRPDEVVHFYDDNWRPEPRVALYDGYKAQRAPDPPELPWQFELLRQILDALGTRQASAPGWEAEDAIGTFAAQGSPKDRFDIVTGDRDLIQLVRDPQIRVLFTLRGVSELAGYDEAGVLKKYGVPASRYAEFAILRGDPSDGLPGVSGVGEKTARELVTAYRSLDELAVDAARAVPKGDRLRRSPRLHSSLKESQDYLAAMRQVVPIRRDLELRTWKPDPIPERQAELASAHNLEGPVNRLVDALDRSGPVD